MWYGRHIFISNGLRHSDVQSTFWIVFSKLISRCILFIRGTHPFQTSYYKGMRGSWRACVRVLCPDEQYRKYDSHKKNIYGSSLFENEFPNTSVKVSHDTRCVCVLCWRRLSYDMGWNWWMDGCGMWSVRRVWSLHVVIWYFFFFTHRKCGVVRYTTLHSTSRRNNSTMSLFDLIRFDSMRCDGTCCVLSRLVLHRSILTGQCGTLTMFSSFITYPPVRFVSVPVPISTATTGNESNEHTYATNTSGVCWNAGTIRLAPNIGEFSQFLSILRGKNPKEKRWVTVTVTVVARELDRDALTL